jgi:hypothetical protein
MKLSMKNMSIRETSFSLLTNNANTTAIECKYTRIYPVEFLLSTVDQIENIQTVCSIYSTYSYQYIRQPGMSKRHSCTGIDFLMHLEPLISKLVCVSWPKKNFMWMIFRLQNLLCIFMLTKKVTHMLSELMVLLLVT